MGQCFGSGIPPHPNHVYLFWIINAFLCLSIWEALDVYIFKMLIDMRIRPLTQGMLQYLWEYWLEAWGNPFLANGDTDPFLNELENN